MSGLIGFFLPIAKALIAGYLVAIAAYMGLLFLVALLGKRVLMRGDTASGVYTALHAVAWFLTAVAGGYVCCYFASLPPYGLVGFPAILAVALIAVQLRNFRQLTGQMTTLALLLNIVCVLGGTAAALYLRDVFKILSNA